MTQTGFFYRNFPISAEFLIGRLYNVFICVGADVFIAAQLLTVPSTLCLTFVCVNRPHVYGCETKFEWIVSDGMQNNWTNERDDKLLGISGGVSFFTYLPTTPSLILSLLFRDSIAIFVIQVQWAAEFRKMLNIVLCICVNFLRNEHSMRWNRKLNTFCCVSYDVTHSGILMSDAITLTYSYHFCEGLVTAEKCVKFKMCGKKALSVWTE